MEKSWQIPFEIDPALVAHMNDAVSAETGLLSSNGHSDENVRWIRALFTTSMTAKYRRAHTVFSLHFTGLSCHSFRAYATSVEHTAPLGRSWPNRKSQCILLRTVDHTNMRL
jgi:hypothetical protein